MLGLLVPYLAINKVAQSPKSRDSESACHARFLRIDGETPYTNCPT